MTLQTKRLLYILLSVPTLLLIPFIAMQFTNEVNWTLADFLLMGILLLGTGLMIEFLLRTVRSRKQQILLVIAAVLMFLLTWAELAVGIFGTVFAGS